MEERFQPGQVVVSTAGRDRGRLYLVLNKDVGGRILVADGETRKVADPKKKNKKHLKVQPHVLSGIDGKIKSGGKLSDQDLRKALREMITSDA